MSTTKVPGSLGTSIAPPPNFGDHDLHAHVAQFYSDDAFLLESLSRFIGTALGAGDAAMVIATPAHREGLARILKSRGLDTSSALKTGRYLSLDAAETLATFMVNGWPDADQFTKVVGGLITEGKRKSSGDDRRIAVFGEMVSLLWSQGKLDAAFCLEQLCTDMAKTPAFSLRCGYPIQGFDRQ